MKPASLARSFVTDVKVPARKPVPIPFARGFEQVKKEICIKMTGKKIISIKT
jgi:hypothetical protein